MKTEKIRLDVMIDLETTSCKPNAGILSISAIPFTITGEPLPEADPMLLAAGNDGLHFNVNLLSCFMEGFDFDKETQEWWVKQHFSVKQSFYKTPLMIRDAIEQLHTWLNGWNDQYNLILWSKGTDFDFPILEHCFEKYGLKTPYLYWNKRDVRTYIADYPEARKLAFSEGKAHNSLDDCRHQIEQVRLAYSLKK